MDTVTLLAGLVLGAITAWRLAMDRATADCERITSELEERIRYWQRQSRLAKADADRLAEQTAAWEAGCQQGRNDMLSLARALGPASRAPVPNDHRMANRPPGD